MVTDGQSWEYQLDPIPHFRWNNAPAGRTVIVTTRKGGVSAGPYAELNLGDHVGDDRTMVLRNRQIVTDAFDIDRLRSLSQQHEGHVIDADDPEYQDALTGATLSKRRKLMPWTKRSFQADPINADGMITASADTHGLAILVADCAPVCVAGSDGIALLHCGWRSVAAGIIDRACEMIGTPLNAGIGPCIAQISYEVGEDVASRFPSEHVAHNKDGSLSLDLAGVIASELLANGADSVDVANIDTATDDRMYSHRGDGSPTGRQAMILI